MTLLPRSMTRRMALDMPCPLDPAMGTMVTEILRHGRERRIFSPSIFRISSSARDKGAVFPAMGLNSPNGSYYAPKKLLKWQ